MPVVLPSESLCTPLVSVEDFFAWRASGAIDAADTPADESLIERALCAATAWLQSSEGCNRRFTLETGVTRYYRPMQSGRVDVIDLVSVTSIALDTTGNRTYATTLAPSDYILWPFNEDRYQEIRSWPLASRSFIAGQMVRVVGEDGYVVNGQVPAAMQQACLILTARYFARRQSPFGVLQLPEMGRVATLPKLDPDVEELIAPYRRSTTWVVV